MNSKLHKRSIHVNEAARNLPDLIDAALQGEEIVIIKDDSVVRLTPANSIKKPRQPGSAEGMVWMSDDFDEPLEEFKEYME
ncbi:MAG: DUF2281 domain-containing protein [Cyanobacteria bacterium P01_G01_bin.39]